MNFQVTYTDGRVNSFRVRDMNTADYWAEQYLALGTVERCDVLYINTIIASWTQR